MSQQRHHTLNFEAVRKFVVLVDLVDGYRYSYARPLCQTGGMGGVHQTPKQNEDVL